MEFLRIKDTETTLTADGREKLKDAKIASLKKMEAEVGVVTGVSDVVHHGGQHGHSSTATRDPQR
jgi:hypothetical protein